MKAYNDSKKSSRNLPDSRKIVHRHLSDKNDVITDEDIKGVRISKELPSFLSVTTGAEAIGLFENENDVDTSNRTVIS